MIGVELRVAYAGLCFILVKGDAASDRHVEAVIAQPDHTLKCAFEGVFSALGVMQLGGPVINRDTEGHFVAILFSKLEEARLNRFAHHRAHSVCEHENFKTSLKRCFHHTDHLGVHERLAAREGDLCDRPAECFDFFKIRLDLGAGHIDEGVVGGRAFDIAICAGDVAECTCVEPERLRLGQRHGCAGLAFGCHVGVLKFPQVGLLCSGLSCEVFHAKPNVFFVFSVATPRRLRKKGRMLGRTPL